MQQHARPYEQPKLIVDQMFDAFANRLQEQRAVKAFEVTYLKIEEE